jgi:SAM-dependent methyltransferase
LRLKNWKYKAALQRVFSAAPQGHRLNFLFQRAIGGLPVSDRSLDAAVELACHHIEKVSKYGQVKTCDARFFEFGAGWDLHMPLALAALGAGSQQVVDIRPLLRPKLVTNIARRLTQLEAPGPDWAPVWPVPNEDLDALLRRARIDYRAPCDARSTGLREDSIDYVTSTNTLEHIPPDEIVAILREVHRILKPSGLASFQVDYNDHYSYFDTTIGPYNYLQFDDRGWHRYNSALHFQNRLRHDDYLRLFRDAGFVLLDEVVDAPTERERAELDRLPLDSRYRGTSLATLGIRSSRVVLAACPKET